MTNAQNKKEVLEMIRKGFFMRVGICLLLLFFAIGVGGISQAAPKAIKVSSVIPMTGVFSGVGQSLAVAYRIVVDKINSEGGVYVKKYQKKLPIEFKVLDDESVGQNTQTQLEFANSWGAVANLGGLGCSSFELGTPIAAKNKFAWIGPGCGGWAPHQLGNEWLFSAFNKTKFLAPMPLEMILENPQQKPRKIAFFEINQLDCQEWIEFMQPTIKEGGFEVVFHQRYPFGTKDFSALITGAKSAGAEILLAYPVPPAGPIIVKQMKELDFSPKITYLTRAAESTRLAPSLGELSDYLLGPVSWCPDFRFPQNDYLLSEFKKRTGKDADPAAGNGYAAGQVLFAAIEKAGTLDRRDIRDALTATDTMTVSGPIRFSKQGWAVDKVLANIQYMDGKPRIVYANPPGKKFPNEVPVTPLKYQPKWSDR